MATLTQIHNVGLATYGDNLAKAILVPIPMERSQVAQIVAYDDRKLKSNIDN